MKYFKTLLLVAGICLAIPKLTEAQTTSTQGKEFWVSFMGNGFKTRYDEYTGQPSFTWLRIQLIVSARRDCNCTVKNPNTSYEQSFHVQANSTYLFDNIPWEEAYMELDEYGQVLSKGLIITADDTISVYCANIAEMSFDASYILPTPALGDDYIIQTYNQSRSNTVYGDCFTSSFVIVAADEGETEIDITPSVNTLEGREANETYHITLHQGESYQVRSHLGYDSRDLSGTRVTAHDCKKIAVFNGNNLTMVPNNGNDSDCVFEQAMPLSAWGKKFVVTASLGRELNDVVKVTSAHDNNVIHRNGVVLATLNAGESTTFELRQSDKSCFIEASHSCAVYMYNHSKDNDPWFLQGVGAPSMVWIAPIEQRINDITFSTFNYDSEHDTDIRDHYVNIIVGTSDIQHVYFDEELLPESQFEAVNGTEDYRFLRKKIGHGTHHLACDNGFNAHVYGIGYARGYAYMVGSNTINLSTSVSVNDVGVMQDESFQYCIDESMSFLADVNHNTYTVAWDFGDGTTSDQNPTTHVYQERRVYPVSVTVTTDDNGCSSSASQTIDFFIDLTQHYIIENDEACTGALYSGYGFNDILINNDTILSKLVDNPTFPECKDSLLLYISARKSYHIPVSDSRCWIGEPGIYDNYGFSFEYDHPGSYDRQLELLSIDGCDSIISLHLDVAEHITHEFWHHECNGDYIWDGTTYSEAGVYSKLYNTAGGCDSLVTLHLTMGTNKYVSFDTITCTPFEWNEYIYDTTGDYTQVFPSHDGCDSTVLCHLVVGSGVEGPTTYASDCDAFSWNDSIYTVSGLHTKVYPSAIGCDSIVFLDLDLEYTPNPTEIFPVDPANIWPHWVITATEFQINTYEFDFKDNDPACHWDSTYWRIENPDVQWILEPDTISQHLGETCKIIVLNTVRDTVWISATAYNRCHPEGVERRYWLLCSFYGLEEQQYKAQLDVVPNPNKGQMDLRFEHFEETADVRVYDMKGMLIDHFQVFNGTGEHTHHYAMRTISQGVYLFVVTGKDGILTKKVIVAQ